MPVTYPISKQQRNYSNKLNGQGKGYNMKTCLNFDYNLILWINYKKEISKVISDIKKLNNLRYWRKI